LTSIALFGNKGGIGKTTLTYHLAHMMQRLGRRVLAVDLDPQADLTVAFLDDDQLEVIWGEAESRSDITIAAAVQPIMDGIDDIEAVDPVQILDGLWLLPGDLGLSSFEDRLSEAWPRGFDGSDRAASRTTTAFYRIIRRATEQTAADIVLIDMGSNLGAINRAAVLAADSLLMPLAPDLLSLRGLRNLGPTLNGWRVTWQTQMLPDAPNDISAPSGSMIPLGYVIMQPAMRLDRPVLAYRRWLDRIPGVFHSAVLGEEEFDPSDESYEIATVRNYQSLRLLSHDARKPMFDLRAADGALGSTQTYVQKCYQDFRDVAQELLARLDDVIPPL
jgi:chromosome partitioning protein